MFLTMSNKYFNMLSHFLPVTKFFNLQKHHLYESLYKHLCEPFRAIVYFINYKKDKRNDERFNNRSYSLFFLMVIFRKHLRLISII